MAAKSLNELLGDVTRFGSLSLLGEAEPKEYRGKRHRRAHMRCDCGEERIVEVGSLRQGKTVSCGCAKAAYAKSLGAASRTHGHAGNLAPTSEYRIWKSMKTRCTNSKHRYFSNYGGRGIAVCARWMESFEDFFADMGPRPSPALTLDRKDNDGNYEPGNCRWATRAQQIANRRC